MSLINSVNSEWWLRLFSFSVENLGDIGQAIEHVKLFVTTLKQLEVCGGDDLGDLGFLDVFDMLSWLFNVEVHQLVQQLLAVISF